MQQSGIDIRPYDINIPSETWTKVKKGDPSILSKKKSTFPANTSLFLCYPDEGSSVGLECLTHITATTAANESYCQYIIHVGELIHTGCASGAPQAPWGRSSSPDFQVKLSELYHCVISIPLPSFPFSRDFLTVWKRTLVISMKESEENPEDDADEDEWADIPQEERLFNDTKEYAAKGFEAILER